MKPGSGRRARSATSGARLAHARRWCATTVTTLPTSSAIRPARGIGAAIITPAANTECINLHLAEISTHIAPGAVAALIWDGAGWHQSGGELNVPENIVLLPLPPYSPELNPMENVWEYLRANKLSGCVWDNYDAILKACAEAWNWLIGDPDRIRSIGTRDWATVNV